MCFGNLQNSMWKNTLRINPKSLTQGPAKGQALCADDKMDHDGITTEGKQRGEVRVETREVYWSKIMKNLMCKICAL